MFQTLKLPFHSTLIPYSLVILVMSQTGQQDLKKKKKEEYRVHLRQTGKSSELSYPQITKSLPEKADIFMKYRNRCTEIKQSSKTNKQNNSIVLDAVSHSLQFNTLTVEIEQLPNNAF